jgi:hypothetical protein
MFILSASQFINFTGNRDSPFFNGINTRMPAILNGVEAIEGFCLGFFDKNRIL